MSVRWSNTTTQDDLADGAAFLSLTVPRATIGLLTAQWRSGAPSTYEAKDLLRAAGLVLLPTSSAGVAKYLGKIGAGESLAPVLVVLGDRDDGVPLTIAEGYHRLCAAYHTGEAEPVTVLTADVDATSPTPVPNPPPPPAPAPNPQPTPTPAPTTRKPVDVLDLRNWTVMLPTGSDGDPDNLYPSKAGVIPGVLYVDDTGAVVFEAPTNGFHSSGSKYPRTELREMADANWTKAAWSSGTSSKPVAGRALEAELAIDTSGLTTRKRINGMQIHDGGDDVCQIMAREDGKLGLAHNDGDSFEVIDPAYKGQRFTCKIVVTGKGRLQVIYNGALKVDVPKTGTGWYWKAGAYLQTGGSSTYVEPAGARGRVKIWRLIAS